MGSTISIGACGARGHDIAAKGRGSEEKARGRGKGRPAKSKAARRNERAGPSERASLYDEVTSRIIAQLEAGHLPWVQPWGRVGGAATGLPRNALSGRCYSGINILLLWGEVIAQGFSSQGWLTFRQALEAGGAVRKGERGTTVVYADRFIPKGEAIKGVAAGEGEGGKASLRGSDGPPSKAVPFLKRFTVFNVAQCEGLPDTLAADPAPLPDREIIPVAEALIAASKADFRIGGAQAFYDPSADFIRVPPQPAFFEQINYYRTALHELTHWTGHPSRLARDFSGNFGTQTYAREELAAEMGSAFLCAALGIVPTVRHADYLGNWLTLLRGDNHAIFRAASAASKAADFLLRLRDGSTDAEAAPPIAAGEGLRAGVPGALPAMGA